jgi:hypothetical protein
MTRLLVIGASGSGKTTVGERLAGMGWRHVDCEALTLANPGWLADPVAAMPTGGRVVATWGVLPAHLPQVWALMGAGFLVVGLDGDPPLLARDLRARGESEAFLSHPDRAETRRTVGLVRPRVCLDVYRPDGCRWDVAAFLEDIYGEERDDA